MLEYTNAKCYLNRLNHSETPNVGMKKEKKKYVWRTSRDVKGDEELTWDYGEANFHKQPNFPPNSFSRALREVIVVMFCYASY